LVASQFYLSITKKYQKWYLAGMYKGGLGGEIFMCTGCYKNISYFSEWPAKKDHKHVQNLSIKYNMGNIRVRQ
jgi:hypothetical protein